MNNKEINEKVTKTIPKFSWGGTTKKWEFQASKLSHFLEEQMEKQPNDNLKSEKHYYLRDQN